MMSALHEKQLEDDIVVLEIKPESDIVFSQVTLNENQDNLKKEIDDQQKVFSLQYLKVFDRDELRLLEEKYNKPREELEKLIADYHYSYWYYQSKSYLSLLLNIFYLAFQINASKEGFKTFINVIHPNTDVPDGLASAVGIASSLGDFLFYSLTFSPPQQSAKSTIDYALQDPVHKQIKDFLHFLYQKPCTATVAAMKYVFHQTVLTTHHLTGAMTEIIDNMSEFNKFPAPAKWISISTLLYFGNYYYKKFMNEDYFSGLNFWRNEMNYPWLIGEIKRGHLITPLQIFLQGIISTVGLYSYPFYYYLAAASERALGVWMPPAITAILVAWHNLCVLYPATFNHYMADQKKIHDALKEEVNWESVSQSVRNQINQWQFDHMTEDEQLKWKEQVIEAYIKLQKDLIATKVREEDGMFYLFKQEPHLVLPVAYRGAIGGYLGYQYLAPLFMLAVAQPLLMSGLGVVIGAGALTGLLYKAEQYRVMDKLVLKQIEKDKTQEIEEEKINPGLSTFVKIASYTLSISNGVSNAMATIGTGVRTLGGSSPFVLGATALVAVENMFNGIFYSTGKVANAVKNLIVSTSTCVSKMPGTMFHHSKQVSPVSAALEKDNLLAAKI